MVSSASRVAGGGKYRALVVFQDFEPRRDIGGVAFPSLRGNTEVGA
jgi:hypothetical protein